MILDEHTREVLSRRSVRDKFAILVSCALLDPEDLKVITILVREGYIVWLDRAVVSELRVFADVYQLTAKGIELCEANGIKQR